MSNPKQKTTSCPECGNEEYETSGAMSDEHRGCTKCGQEWFADINYNPAPKTRERVKKYLTDPL